MELRLNHRTCEMAPLEAAKNVHECIFDSFIVSFRILGGTNAELSEFFTHLDYLIGREIAKMDDMGTLERAQTFSCEQLGNLTRRVVHGLNMVTAAEMRWLFSPEDKSSGDSPTPQRPSIKEDRDGEEKGKEDAA